MLQKFNARGVTMNGCQESLMLEDVPAVSPIILTEIKKTKEIPLTKGMVAIVDIDKYEELSKYKWYAQKGNYTFYPARRYRENGRRYLMLMSRYVMGCHYGDGIIVDHKNRNGLDNRIVNLRLATRSINNLNCKLRVDNKSGFRGVGWDKQHKKWVAQIRINKTTKKCGRYQTPWEAAIAFDRVAYIYRGDNAQLNFPHINMENQ